MKKYLRNLKGLWITMAIGLAVGVILLMFGVHKSAPLWVPLSSGLVYLRIRWLKKVNRSNDGTKLKPL